MAFERYQYQADHLAAKAAEMAGDDPAGFPARAAAVMVRRLMRDPASYVSYGPYWWALKDALNQHGADLGDCCDTLVREAYAGADPAQTLVAADLFHRHALETWSEGARVFDLSDDAPPYVLEDHDMEAVIAAMT